MREHSIIFLYRHVLYAKYQHRRREKIHIDNVFATKYQHMVIFVPFWLSYMCVFFLQIYKIQKFMAIADISGWNFYTHFTKDHLSGEKKKRDRSGPRAFIHPKI